MVILKNVNNQVLLEVRKNKQKMLLILLSFRTRSYVLCKRAKGWADTQEAEKIKTSHL